MSSSSYKTSENLTAELPRISILICQSFENMSDKISFLTL